jgi:hypothetical protein
MGIPMPDWLDVLDKFYLSDFIKNGGAAFKMLLTRDEAGVSSTLCDLRRRAEDYGYFYVQVSSAQTRVDRIDQIFFAVARQLDWDMLMTRDAAQFLHSHDYAVPEGTSLSDTTAIAAANGIEQEELLSDLRRATRQEIVGDRRMCKEFRTALAYLRNAQLFPRNVSPSDAETLEGWLRGEKISMSALRDLRIYSKIGRHNARDMLSALAHWLAKSLGQGLIIGLDLSALMNVSPRTADEEPQSLRYSRSALLDTYEVLRQFIDETDDITHCLICASAPSGIITDEKRSMVKQYYALHNRLVNEAHDRDRENPLAAMVHLDNARLQEGV